MPSPKFCDLPPSDAAVQVKRMLGHAPSRQSAHTFWSNLTTLGQIQQNQRLEIDSQGVFRLESTDSRKWKTLRFASSRSITELYPDVLAVLYRAQIESFFPTPQLSKVLGSKLAVYQPYTRDSNRRSSISRSVGFIDRESTISREGTPQEGYARSAEVVLDDMKSSAEQVADQLQSARAGLGNMLRGYQSQNSRFNSKDAQAARVEDLVQQAGSPLMPFGIANNKASIAQCIQFKIDLCLVEKYQKIWDLDSGVRGVRKSELADFKRIINEFRSSPVLMDQYSPKASLLLWGHHVLRDGWVYRDLDFDLFGHDTSDILPCSRVLEEQVDVTQCNVSALKQFKLCVLQHMQKIEPFFISPVQRAEMAKEKP